MATTKQLYDEFKAFMDKLGLRYREFDRDDNIIYIAFGGEYDTYMLVDFDETEGDDADSVHFVSQSIARCTKKNLPAALLAVNQLNQRFRWVKFYITDDGDIACDADARVYLGSVGDECTKTVFMMSEIIEKALADLADVAVPNEEIGKMLAMMAAMNSGDFS